MHTAGRIKDALLVLGVATLAWRAGWSLLVASLEETHDALVARRGALEEDRRFLAGLRVELEELRNRLETGRRMEEAIRPVLLGTDSDRLRMSVERDTAARDLPSLLIRPLRTSAPPEPLPLPTALDLNLELGPLRQRHRERHPRDVFEAWAVPRDVTFLRYDETIQLEAHRSELFTFLDRIAARPLFVDLTELDVVGFHAAPGDEPVFSATIALSALAFASDPGGAGTR